MVNRREFFSGFIRGKSGRPAARRARAPRYQSLETYVVVDLIPYDLSLTSDQERDLRARVRRTLEAASDEDLFSMTIVRSLERLAESFVREIEGGSANPG